MSVYRFDDGTNTPAPQPPPQWNQLTPAATPPRRKRRLGTTALLALALTTGAVGGGAIGTVAAGKWLVPAPAGSATLAAPTNTATTQTTANTSAAQAAPGAATTQSTPNAAQVAPQNVAGSVYNAVNASVVEVIISTAQGQTGLAETGNGSGFVVDAGGLIVTNNHVVEGASAVSVRFSNDEQRDATVVATDVSNDLALIRVTDMPDGIPAVTLGNSDSVQVGETAIAIGSPFGLAQTVTQGIISALNRDWAPNGRPMRDLIQTDTPINPGNSGGPLLNANGEVIGVTTLIESPVRGNVGVGFAVPINTLKAQLPKLQAGQNFEQGYLGITAAQTSANANLEGVTIGDVQPGGGAAQSGLQSGDVITALDGAKIADFEQLVSAISGRQPGETVTLTINRTGQTRDVQVTLQSLAQQTQP